MMVVGFEEASKDVFVLLIFDVFLFAEELEVDGEKTIPNSVVEQIGCYWSSLFCITEYHGHAWQNGVKIVLVLFDDLLDDCGLENGL